MAFLKNTIEKRQKLSKSKKGGFGSSVTTASTGNVGDLGSGSVTSNSVTPPLYRIAGAPEGTSKIIAATGPGAWTVEEQQDGLKLLEQQALLLEQRKKSTTIIPGGSLRDGVGGVGGVGGAGGAVGGTAGGIATGITAAGAAVLGDMVREQQQQQQQQQHLLSGTEAASSTSLNISSTSATTEAGGQGKSLPLSPSQSSVVTSHGYPSQHMTTVSQVYPSQQSVVPSSLVSVMPLTEMDRDLLMMRGGHERDERERELAARQAVDDEKRFF